MGALDIWRALCAAELPRPLTVEEWATARRFPSSLAAIPIFLYFSPEECGDGKPSVCGMRAEAPPPEMKGSFRDGPEFIFRRHLRMADGGQMLWLYTTEEPTPVDVVLRPVGA